MKDFHPKENTLPSRNRDTCFPRKHRHFPRKQLREWKHRLNCSTAPSNNYSVVTKLFLLCCCWKWSFLPSFLLLNIYNETNELHVPQTTCEKDTKLFSLTWNCFLGASSHSKPRRTVFLTQTPTVGADGSIPWRCR